MELPTVKQLAWAAAAATAMAGCSLQYNGAWGMRSTKTDPSKDASATAGQTAKPPANPEPAKVVFEHPAGTEAPPTSATSESGNPAAAAPAPSGGERPASPAASPMRPLALFGDLPSGSTAGKAAGPSDNADNIRRVTFTGEGSDFDPEVDPTGMTLLYSSTQHRKTADIYLKHIGGTAVTELTNGPGDNMMPTFSPDGSKVAFCSNRTGNWNIYMMEVAGGQAVQITSGRTDDVHPSFSPDGKRLVYCSNSAQSGQWEMAIIDLEHPGTKKFIGAGLFPRWSPAGDKIVFQRARERGTRWFSIWTLDLVNGEALRPTEIVASTNAAAITPRWSPDGKSVVFCTVIDPAADFTKSPSQADVWVVNADGSGKANLTQSPFANLQPTWSKDGTIYFASTRGESGSENIWSIRADGAVRVARHEPAMEPPMKTADQRPAHPAPMPEAVPSNKPALEPSAMKMTPMPPATQPMDKPAGNTTAAVDPPME